MVANETITFEWTILAIVRLFWYAGKISAEKSRTRIEDGIHIRLALVAIVPETRVRVDIWVGTLAHNLVSRATNECWRDFGALSALYAVNWPQHLRTNQDSEKGKSINENR